MRISIRYFSQTQVGVVADRTRACAPRRYTPSEVFYSTSIDRSYKHKDGMWQRTSNFRHEELNIVRKLAAKAEAFIDDLLLEVDAA
jgi:hypothetical protein